MADLKISEYPNVGIVTTQEIPVANSGVTNKITVAQVKTEAQDIASLTAKTSLVAADMILINDSVASNAPKKILFSNFNSNLSSYDTGWINRSLWQNKHLGTNTTKNVDSNVTHSLNTNLSHLLVKVMISTDGTDANSFDPYMSAGDDLDRGMTINEVGQNDIIVQTGADGVTYFNASGNLTIIQSQDWYYKITVFKLG